MNRNSWVNIRGLAIFAVILIHSSANLITGHDNVLNSDLLLTINQLARFAVPIFYISSGFGLVVTGKQNLTILEFYSTRIKILILDYSPRYWGHEIASGRSESNVWIVANTD